MEIGLLKKNACGVSLELAKHSISKEIFSELYKEWHNKSFD